VASHRLAEIEVTDPAHPLYGRSYPVVSVSTQPGANGYVFVLFGGRALVRIAKLATNLFPRIGDVGTKLSPEALSDLITSIAEGEAECVLSRKSSGTSCVPRCEAQFSTTSQRPYKS